MEEKALIWDKFIVFRDFGTWCLISGQSQKIRGSWNLWIHVILSNKTLMSIIKGKVYVMTCIKALLNII